MSEKPEDQLREERFYVLDRIWSDNANLDPDKAEELVAPAIAAGRE